MKLMKYYTCIVYIQYVYLYVYYILYNYTYYIIYLPSDIVHKKY